MVSYLWGKKHGEQLNERFNQISQVPVVFLMSRLKSCSTFGRWACDSDFQTLCNREIYSPSKLLKATSTYKLEILHHEGEQA